MSETEIRELHPDTIRTDGGTQMRPSLDHAHVEDIKAKMSEGLWQWETYDKVIIFYDGTTYWLVDGFHRHRAASLLDIPLMCEIHHGSLQDAIWYATSTNKSHGLKRSNKTIERTVMEALRHPASQGKSSRELAEWVGVTHTTINNYRAILDGKADPRQERKRNNRIGGKGSPLKQIDEWWGKAPEPEKKALYQKIVTLATREGMTA